MAQQQKRGDDDYLRAYGEQLSDSTKRAQWIDRIDQHEGHAGQSLATRDHDVIRHWAEERKAQPATIQGTEKGDRPGVLRFDFPGYEQRGKLQPVSWDDWFRTFDTRDLVMVFQEHLKNGHQSNFFKMDSPHREKG